MAQTLNTRPSHFSASVMKAIGLSHEPVASHIVDSGQSIPFRLEKMAPDGFGLGWMVQELPSHTSMRVFSRPPAAELPTAVHAVEERHHTLLRAARVPVGLGAYCSDHTVPSQPMTSGESVVVALDQVPTAVQAVDEVQETPLRTSFSPPDTVCSIVQVDPFQSSLSGCVIAPLTTALPTAMQNELDVQETLSSITFPFPDTFCGYSKLHEAPSHA